MLQNIKGQADLVQAHERSSKAMLEHRMKTFKTQILEQTTQQSSTKRTSTVSVCLKQSQSHTPQ
jgi:hypothetical protein